MAFFLFHFLVGFGLPSQGWGWYSFSFLLGAEGCPSPRRETDQKEEGKAAPTIIKHFVHFPQTFVIVFFQIFFNYVFVLFDCFLIPGVFHVFFIVVLFDVSDMYFGFSFKMFWIFVVFDVCGFWAVFELFSYFDFM